MPNSRKSKASVPSVFGNGWIEKPSPVHKFSANFCDLINFWRRLYADKPSRICDHVFTGISVQRAVKTSSGFNVPSEISVVNFSWNQGVSESKFHRFIKPDVPRGFRADALTETEIHKIPPEGGPNCSNDLDSILSEMQDFISYVDDCAFVFCVDAEYDTVRDGLKYMENRVMTTYNRRNITIIKITDLFLTLKWWNDMDHSKPDDLPTSEQIKSEMSAVNECLSRSCYTFKANIRCDFHKQKDVAFCSLSTANLSWLHLSDYLAEVYPREEQRDKVALPQPTSLPVVRNSMMKIDPSALNNLNLSPKVSKITEKLATKSVEESTYLTTKNPTIVWMNSKINDGDPSAVASKRCLSSLPALCDIKKEIAEPVPVKCSSPEVIDLVLPQTWSEDLKRSEKKTKNEHQFTSVNGLPLIIPGQTIGSSGTSQSRKLVGSQVVSVVSKSNHGQLFENRLVGNHLPPSINNGVTFNENRLNFHPDGFYRNPGLSNGGNNFPLVGFGHGGVPVLPDYQVPRSRSRQSAQCTNQAAEQLQYI